METIINRATISFLRLAADLAIWLWTILFKGASCHPYNVGSDQEITIADLARTVASVFGGSVQLSSTSQSLNHSTASLANSTLHFNSTPNRYVPDTQLILSELALAEIIVLEEGIRRTLHSLSINQPRHI